MSPKFNIGDKILCNGMDPIYSDQLIPGVIYTVGNNSHLGWVMVLENNLYNSYEEKYFTLVKKKEELKPKETLIKIGWGF